MLIEACLFLTPETPELQRQLAFEIAHDTFHRQLVLERREHDVALA